MEANTCCFRHGDFPEPAVHSPTRLSLCTGAGPVLLWFFYKAFNCLSLFFFFFPFKSLEVNTETNESRASRFGLDVASPGVPAPRDLARGPGPAPACFQDGVAERALHRQSRGWGLSRFAAGSLWSPGQAPSPLRPSLPSQGQGWGTPGVRGCSQQEVNQTGSVFSHDETSPSRRSR